MAKSFKKDILGIFLVFCVTFLFPTDIVGNDNFRTVVIALSIEDSKNSTTTLLASSSEGSNAQSTKEEGFEKVPQRPVYGPLGFLLKIIEFTLDKLYILFEY